MFEFAGELETTINIIFLVVTGGIAVHALKPRPAPDAAGGEAADEGAKKRQEMSNFVRMLFGCIAAVFFFMVLFQDVLGVANFGG